MSERIKHVGAWAVGFALLTASVLHPAHAVAGERMTKEKVLEYIKRFDAEDVRYAEIYSPDVVFPHITAGDLHGPQEIVGFYKKLWDSGVNERREANAIIIDNDAGLMAVEQREFFTCKPGFASVVLPSGETMKAGETWGGASVIIYTIKDGKITSIRGSLNPPTKITRISPP